MGKVQMSSPPRKRKGGGAATEGCNNETASLKRRINDSRKNKTFLEEAMFGVLDGGMLSAQNSDGIQHADQASPPRGPGPGRFFFHSLPKSAGKQDQ